MCIRDGECFSGSSRRMIDLWFVAVVCSGVLVLIGSDSRSFILCSHLSVSKSFPDLLSVRRECFSGSSRRLLDLWLVSVVFNGVLVLIVSDSRSFFLGSHLSVCKSFPDLLSV